MGAPKTYAIILAAGSPLLYRLAVVSAAILGGRLIMQRARTWPLSPADRRGVFMAVGLGGLVGGALPALFAGGAIGELAQSFFNSPELGESGAHLGNWIPAFFIGPKTILGGLFFGFAGAALYKRTKRIHFDTSDSFATGACLMMAIGRLGCIGQHCCFGRVVLAQLYMRALTRKGDDHCLPPTF